MAQTSRVVAIAPKDSNPGLDRSERADAGELGTLIAFFYRREERVALRAISLAEIAVERSGGVDKLLEAASAKITRRRTGQRAERDLMRARMIQLAGRVSTKLDTVAAGVRDKVEGCEAAVDGTSTTTVYRFRSQIVELARQRGYWADLREPWEWVRLQLRDGGITDVVVVVHFIGNPSPGACAAVAFMEHRATDEYALRPERIPIDTETLVLYPAEEPASQRARLASWLDEIVQTSLTVWIKYL